ncbi:MAG: sugar nucleotide-binding protein [Myxococcota bacterium]|nr:sugar nucleotide-binding protein [Myxococcota bacterium]
MTGPGETGTVGALELWAGVECTVNRVGERWVDQTVRTGHDVREDDIDRLAAMGARAVRYPVLWERTAPLGLEAVDWSWPDARLLRLRALGLRPIVGLVHHGSGPAGTSLVDDTFPQKLAAYAHAVAERYPWVEDFTPINEPLTTARFSGLYGHWYPHGRDPASFARALVNECRATALAMRAIREVTPAARLVQTEDMGTVFSTPRLAYQARFENARRWLTFDLLCGRIGASHPMRRHLTDAGIEEPTLDSFEDEPCPPQVVGINYYVTSDRFLDERLDRYPRHTHGGNGRDSYADVEAVRVRGEGIVGHRARLEEAWRRYGLPVALTEVHLGCTREEQLRWLRDAWRGAVEARNAGADVRAVTVWSAFGAVDWDSLLTESRGHYESGVYDVRSSAPRPTALVALARELSGAGEGSHPVLDTRGWWQREERLVYPPHGEPEKAPLLAPGRPVLVTGGTGTLGRAFSEACTQRGLAHHVLSRSELDIADPSAVSRVLHETGPWAVINAAGYTSVERAEREPARCYRENTWGATAMAAACQERGISLMTFSSDLVFDGARSQPYVESDAPAPLSAYGWSKARAERAVLESHSSALVVRTSACFGPGHGGTYVGKALAALRQRQAFLAPSDVVASLTYLPDLVRVALDLLVDGATGIWHLANEGAVTALELVRRIAGECGVPTRGLLPCSAAALGLTARRPRYSVLGSERASLMPSLDDAIARYAQEQKQSWRRVGAA